LDHGIDLNFKVVINNTRTTPLYWAIEHGDVESVKLFLSKTRQNLHRVAGTQALGVAVDSKDAAIVREILAHGIYCDFEEDDRPPPRPSYCTGWELFELSDPEGFLRFLAPLVRAVKHGDIEIVRLLLENGANVNVAYHDVPWQFDSLLQDGKRIGFSCGRAVQLGMELERKEIVQLLLCSGADIGLKQPIWDRAGRDHRCEYVPRAIYQRVIHGLRNISDEARRDVS
jgi:serum/glucocorticoid-regulated kinase 2